MFQTKGFGSPQFQPFLMKKIHVVCVILLWKNISVNKFCAILHALFIGGSNLLWKKLQFTFIQLNLTIFVSSLNLHCTT
jgi:hypothetical protein